MDIDTIDIKNQSGKQSIEIPEQFKIDDDDKVYIRKTGNVISIIPYHSAWQNLTDSLQNFTEDSMEERKQPGNNF